MGQERVSPPPGPLRATGRSEMLLSDDHRVICRFLDLQSPARVRGIVDRILAIPDADVPGILARVMKTFSHRHRDIEAAFGDHCRQAARHARLPAGVSEQRKLLIGAFFTMEYSIEAAALFNPSIVPHPDQSDLPAGSVRFLMSLRATGEGHVSSIVFRRGVIDQAGSVRFDPAPRYAYTGRPIARMVHKQWLIRKLRGAEVAVEEVGPALALLPDSFGASDVATAKRAARREPDLARQFRRVAPMAQWLASANYRLEFPPDCHASEIVVFPATEFERAGMEDLRLVRFQDDDGSVRYYGTYTAYNGTGIHPMLLETEDFTTFQIHTLSGRYARNKGLALFPRRLDGQYAMLGRHDGENLHLLRSRDLDV